MIRGSILDFLFDEGLKEWLKKWGFRLFGRELFKISKHFCEVFCSRAKYFEKVFFSPF